MLACFKTFFVYLHRLRTFFYLVTQKRKIMKKFLMIAAMMLMSMGAFAQEAGRMAIGANAAYGFASNYKTFGLGAKFQYCITDDFRAEASGTYFFKKDFTSAWDANLTLQYLIPITEGLYVYPLLGPTVFGIKVDIPDFSFDFGDEVYHIEGGSGSETRFGVNAGGGIEYFVTENFKINAEAKYQYTKDSDWPVISIGAAYVF